MVLKRLYRSLLYRAARSYIAGPTVADAVRVCKRAADHGWGSTICPWDSSGDSPDVVLALYEESIHAIAGEKFNAYLSIKVPSLRYDESMVIRLLDLAESFRIRVHFDSLAPETAEPSLRLFEHVRSRTELVSYTLPAHWPRSLADARRLTELDVAVRVVKGQWRDPAAGNVRVEDNFMAIINTLAGKVRLVGVATHDAPLAKKALDQLQKTQTPVELEQLFGLPLGATGVAAQRHLPVRIYVPFGHAYLSYATSKILRPRTLMWFLRDVIATRPRGRELSGV